MRAVANGFSEKVGDLIDDMDNFSNQQDLDPFLDSAKVLQDAAEDLQDSLFEVDSNLTIIELYRVDSEIEKLKREWIEHKNKMMGTSNLSTSTAFPITNPSCKTLFSST